MKKQYLIFSFFILLLFVITSCNGQKKEENSLEILDDELYEFKGFSLKNYDIPATIMLPDETANIGASTEPEIKHSEDDFRWELMVGPNFHMIIDDWGDDREMVKEEKRKLEGLKFYKIKYIYNEADFIMYERILTVDGEKSAPKSVGLVHKSYHVFGQKVINNITYVFRSRDDGFEKMIIELMAKSIRSVKPINEKV
ncbi:MAG: hypothetical protein HYU67_10825 [Flavobacteriia bacterium]|nr:hypothetical protein [Flavobacteriia bacterium]